VDAYGEKPLDWGLNDEATFGGGGCLNDFMNASTNHYDVTTIRRVSRAQYDAVFSERSQSTATTTSTSTALSVGSEEAGAVSRKRRQREDEVVGGHTQAKEGDGHPPPREKRHKENGSEETQGDAKEASHSKAVEHISFGERVSVQWNGDRYERSVLKKDHIIAPAGDGTEPLPHQVVPAIVLPKSGHVNLTLRGHRFSSKGVALLGEVLRYVLSRPARMQSVDCAFGTHNLCSLRVVVFKRAFCRGEFLGPAWQPPRRRRNQPTG
jgi:hypothetical protein